MGTALVAVSALCGGALLTIQDLRGREEVQRLRKTQEDRERLLDFTTQQIKVGIWGLDLSTNELTWSRETFRIHDVEPGPAPSLEEAVRYYTPKAREWAGGARGWQGAARLGHLPGHHPGPPAAPGAPPSPGGLSRV